MKSTLKFTAVLGMGALLTLGFAAGEARADHHEVAVMQDSAAPTAPAAAVVEVGNKICPISGERVDSMGEGFSVEHEGKIYKLCCGMCAKDFEKDPAKYIQKINEELQGAAGGAQEESGHDHGAHGQ